MLTFIILCHIRSFKKSTPRFLGIVFCKIAKIKTLKSARVKRMELCNLKFKNMIMTLNYIVVYFSHLFLV